MTFFFHFFLSLSEAPPPPPRPGETTTSRLTGPAPKSWLALGRVRELAQALLASALVLRVVLSWAGEMVFSGRRGGDMVAYLLTPIKI